MTAVAVCPPTVAETTAVAVLDDPVGGESVVPKAPTESVNPAELPKVPLVVVTFTGSPAMGFPLGSTAAAAITHDELATPEV